MKARIFFLIFFFAVHIVCAMQKQHHHHERQHTPEVIVIEIQQPQQREQPSPHTEEVRYDRKKKLALIGLVTAALAGGTAVVVYLTK